jgi:two-component system LytT family response regulator
VRVLIVDDEALAREQLRRLLGRYDDVEIVGEAADGRSALALISCHAPEVIFLDVTMPGGDGFAVAASLPKPGPAMVFVTASEQHAVQAFDSDAADYLLKPISRERLERSLQRLRGSGKMPANLDAPLPRLLITDRGQTRVVPSADVIWLESADNYVQVHTSAQSLLMRATLGALLSTLGREFVQIHRSSAVAVSRVIAVWPRGKGDATVVLDGNIELPCSRQHRAALIERLSPGSLADPLPDIARTASIERRGKSRSLICPACRLSPP